MTNQSAAAAAYLADLAEDAAADPDLAVFHHSTCAFEADECDSIADTVRGMFDVASDAPTDLIEAYVATAQSGGDLPDAASMSLIVEALRA